MFFRTSHEQRQQAARQAAASRDEYEQKIKEFVNEATTQDSSNATGTEVLVSPTRTLSSSSMEKASPSCASPQDQAVRAWALGKSLVSTPRAFDRS